MNRYINGKKNGNMFYYFPDTKVQKIIPYIDDKKNGLAYEFDSDSIIISITRFRENEVIYYEEINRYNNKKEKEGVWKFFDSKGKITEEEIHKVNHFLYFLEGFNGVNKFFHKEELDFK